MAERSEPQEPTSKEKAQAGQKEHARLRPWHVISSVFAAGLGVQSSRNRERDFKQGKAGVFIAAGLIFTVLFIAAVFTIVQVVLSSAS